MTDGYTVEEAASVLGVPSGRVWELIARGVLAGSQQEGGDMLVFLQPRATPVAAARSVEPPRHNGNGGAHDAGEGSPFRELLTEFRNLTERYGQALLALGEARGEVASLRSRVDLLESRIDLRLPTGAPRAAPLAWAAPEPPAATVTPSTEAPPSFAAAPTEVASAPEEVADADQASSPDELVAAEAEHDAAIAAADLAAMATEEADDTTGPLSTAEAAAKRRRARRRSKKGAHPASAEIVEALARAEDPSLGELPARPETADALPRFDDALSAASTAENADGDAALPTQSVAAERLMTGEEPPAPANEPSGTVDELAPSVEQPVVEVAPIALASEGPPPSVEPLESSVVPSAEDEGELEPAVSFAPVEPIPPAEAWAGPGDDEGLVAETEPLPDEAAPPLPAYEPLPADAPYTASVDEPDWFSDADLGTWGGSGGTRADAATTRTPGTADDATTRSVGMPLGPAVEPAVEPVRAHGPAGEPQVVVRRVSSVELPGAGDLREALEALDALRPRTRVLPDDRQRLPEEAADAAESGAAGRAYRRLRRLFPG